MQGEKNFIIEALGWYGALAILISFFLVSFGYVSPHSLPYLFGNLTGALGLMIEAKSRKAYPSIFLNIVYGLVALLAIVRFFY
jgi:hypothetical protein